MNWNSTQHRHITKPNINPKIQPNSTQHRPKIDPKSMNNRPKIGSGADLASETIFGPIFVQFWFQLRTYLGPSWGPSWVQVGAMLAKKLIFGSSRRHAKTAMISNTFRDPLGTDVGTIWGSKIGPRSVLRTIMKQMQHI